MVAVKARHGNGRIELPADFAGHEPCEVRVLFPDEATPRKGLGDCGASRRAAGAWRGLVDGEALKKMIYESRGYRNYGTPGPPDSEW